MASEPEALIAWFGSLGLRLERIGLEAGPLSQWLYAALREVGLAVELLETRHVKAALSAMPVKTDRNDARGIAQLMRLGWFRPVHCKSAEAQEIRALLTARKLVQSRLYDVEMSLRGILRGFGLKIGRTTPKRFAERIGAGRRPCNFGSGRRGAAVGPCRAAARIQRLREAGSGDRSLRPAGATLDVNAWRRRDRGADRCLSDRRSCTVQVIQVGGAHFGLTPTKYQSGETDVTGRISKLGDGSVRTALYEAANVILTRPIKGGGLKSWAMKLAKRAGMKKAKVALARKLAVILHRMLADASKFIAEKASGCVRIVA